MNTAETNFFLIEGYLKLLSTLDLDTRLELISKLTQTVKNDLGDRKNNFFRSFGAWQSDETADEIIKDLRTSRSVSRQLESFE